MSSVESCWAQQRRTNPKAIPSPGLCSASVYLENHDLPASFFNLVEAQTLRNFTLHSANLRLWRTAC
jgi:hypothetical protein